MDVGLTLLGREGLRKFQLLQADAVSVVTERLLRGVWVGL